MDLTLSSLPKIGPASIKKLANLNITTSLDLLYHLPFRYLDFSKITTIDNLSENDFVTIQGQIIDFQNIYTRFGKNLQKAIIKDKTGVITAIWFNSPFLSKSLTIGQTISLAGQVNLYQHKFSLFTPYIGNSTGKIIPIYHETKGLSSSWFRNIFSLNLLKLISSISDPLPVDIQKKYQLLSLPLALKNIHQPQNQSLLDQAINRLSLNEILSLQVTSKFIKEKQQASSVHRQLKSVKLPLNSLPFSLTNSQHQVISEVLSDLVKSSPANRLIQGDVGSGKTVVALAAAYFVQKNRQLSILMAPTDILANQHYLTAQKLFPKLKISLLTSSHQDQIPQTGLLISTHAVIYHQKKLPPVSLLIIDEQHKFGVLQRSFLNHQANPPHLLTMTATPIPRSIGLTVLKHLDLSYLDTIPQNRPIIKSFLVPPSKEKDCFQWLSNHLQTTKQQGFVVCPFIEESENLESVKAATTTYENLKIVLPDLKIALIHGKTKTEDRQKILADFAKNKINLLVTTPIIEVGIDYPNATVMIIQSADRFGLAQLHQLRGRVGRSQLQSYCYFFSATKNQPAINRLKYLINHHSGLEIATYDLQTRGPGEIFSLIQHGFPSLKLASINQTNLISQADQLINDISLSCPNYDFHQLTANSTQLDRISN
ncbi:MAG TPA: ATP-dependent DNA helicase RecG [Candidatus Woesebacteria bacterium]|nr:ATP-dependent DNA helicase RecG [Candidatus Woesebacteria bacterium]